MKPTKIETAGAIILLIGLFIISTLLALPKKDIFI